MYDLRVVSECSNSKQDNCKPERIKKTVQEIKVWFYSMSAALTSELSRMCSMQSTKGLAALCFFGAMLSVSVLLLDVPAFAEQSHTTSTRIDEDTSLEKTVTVMSIPEGNTMPWGAVKGKINDPTQGHPVIIQFFKSAEEDPVHVAQVGIKGDGSFEYRFRVLSIDEGKTTHYFEGDYIVKIFKVINTPGENLGSV